jgi:hypothetical protein
MINSGLDGTSHFNPDEPRDWHGRWTSGGDDAPMDDASDLGRAEAALACLDRALAVTGQRVAYRGRKQAAACLARLLTPYMLSAGLSDDDFYGAFMPAGTGMSNVPLVRSAIEDLARAGTFPQIDAAAHQLADFAGRIGTGDWPLFLSLAADRVDLEHQAIAGDSRTMLASATDQHSPLAVLSMGQKPRGRSRRSSKPTSRNWRGFWKTRRAPERTSRSWRPWAIRCSIGCSATGPLS